MDTPEYFFQLHELIEHLRATHDVGLTESSTFATEVWNARPASCPYCAPSSSGLGRAPEPLKINHAEPPEIVLHSNKDSEVAGTLITIKPNGTIVPGPKFTTDDEASLRFWDTLARSFPIFLEKARASS